MRETKWLLCPACGGKTRIKLREDTVLENFLMFCPKCKKEMLINIKDYRIEIVKDDLEIVRR